VAPTSSCTSSSLVGGSLVRKFHHRSRCTTECLRGGTFVTRGREL
jgi:hypothetical protein